MGRWTRWSVIATLLVLAACGRLITRPTPTPPSPTPTPSSPSPTPVTPTPTPKPYTPPPTPTPTPTPTPVVYTVQPGDTLLAIARRFGVDVQLIQEVNGILDPRRLRVGQLLIIPVGAATGPPTPTPTPLPLQVQGVYAVRTLAGDVWVLGEAVNVTEVPVENIRLRVALVDAQKRVLKETEVPAASDVILPEGRAPFAARFEEAPETFWGYEVTVVQALPGYLGGYYLDLETVNVSGQGEGARVYFLDGSVYNTGSEDAVEITLIATVYDALGRLVGFTKAPLLVERVPGGSQVPFHLEVHLLGGPVTHWRVAVFGRRPVTPTP